MNERPAETSPPAVSRRSRRARTTRRSVVVGERVSRVFITMGGLGTIVAVVTIFGFLLWVVFPLFRGGTLGDLQSLATSSPRGVGVRALATGSDEYGLIGWTVLADGTLETHAIQAAQPLGRVPLAPDAPPTALHIAADGAASVLGFADGTSRLLRIGFDGKLLPSESLPEPLKGLEPGVCRVHEGGVAEGLPSGDVRLQRLALTLGEPVALTEGPILRIDRSDRSGGWVLATVTASGQAAVHVFGEKTNLANRHQKKKVTRRSVTLPLESPPGAPIPDVVALPAAGDVVYFVWRDGRTQRFDVRDLDRPTLVEALDLVEEPGESVTALTWLLGKTTLVVGDSAGRTRAWFRTKPAQASTEDGSLLLPARTLGSRGVAVTALGSSLRTKLLAVGYADGTVRVVQGTSEREVGSRRLEAGAEIEALAFAPKEDALLVGTRTTLSRLALAAGHPEVSPGALFGKVWYEGLEKPEYVWQSTGGTDDFEPKLSLMPLIFGTLKATLFAMLFGVPIALLAAVFTSEFLSKRLRTSVKSVIEVMASLPSVVLGFLAGIVIAPFVQGVVPAVLTWFLMMPALLLLGAHLWQLLPQQTALRLSGAPRLGVLVALFPVSILLSGWAAPGVERALFRGDLMAWLDHQVSASDLAAAGAAPPVGADDAQRHQWAAQASAEAAGKVRGPGTAPLLTTDQVAAVRREHRAGAVGGWLYLFLPIGLVLVMWLLASVVNPRIRAVSSTWSRGTCAVVALGKLVGGLLLALGIAWLLARGVTQLGWDPRGSFEHDERGQGALLGTYQQRNALVVGFLMGFAIIPIIYTLAEDALTSVPQHLRLGSLAAGATPWQTATRIIIPTATSGLFSAVMIGLGRAVGETMIVLMATGNTSIMEWNWFNGFRTLAANTAVEMPEAVVGSTHYRVLFLSAFVLFGLTFVLNTMAETVRQRFRKRAFQL